MVPLFPIIPIHEGSWSGDDSADHIDDQHHDSDHPNHTNDHSLDSNISAASSVGHIDHNYYSPNWSSEYDNQSAHSFSNDGWVNNDFDSSSSWGSSFDTTRANYEADTHLDNENNLDDVRDSAYVSPRDQLVGVVHHHYYYPKNRYPDNSWQDGGDSDSFSDSSSDSSSDSYSSSSSPSSSSCSTNSCDSSSFSCSDSDGDGDCGGDDD